MPRIDKSVDKIEIGIKIKLKNGEEINLDNDEAKEIYNKLKDIYEKWVTYPIINYPIITAPINPPSRYYEITYNGTSKTITT